MLSFPLLGRSRSWAALSLLVLGFLLTPLAAHAQYPGGGSGGGYPGSGGGYPGGGTYSGPVYSSPGNCTLTTPGDPQSPHVYPYALTSNGFGGGNAYSGSSNGTTSVCTGKITATFTWQPAYAGQTPPQSVIVYESASASYGGSILPKPSGTCADGLGDALVPNTGMLWCRTRAGRLAAGRTTR